MKFFEGKSTNERNKMIAAGVLGVLAIVSLILAFGLNPFSSKTTVTVSASPTPKPTATPRNDADFQMPTVDEQYFGYETTPVVYQPGNSYAPDAGRNIFAFYEPPPPCPTCPTPTPPPVVIPTPTPTPPPPVMITFINPQSVYAGQSGFRLEVNGEKFTPETRIYFNGGEIPTTFVSQERLIADIPASFIAGEGSRMIIVQSPDGKLYSNQTSLNVQPPPKPQFKYIGMTARRHHNNDTAYFSENPGQAAITARLNDVLGGRFRLISISPDQTVFEDVSLGFKHRLPIEKASVTATTGAPVPSRPDRRRGFPGEGYVPYNPNVPGINQPQVQEQIQQDNIPGIPNNIPRYIPPNTNQQQPPDQDSKDDSKDDDEP